MVKTERPEIIYQDKSMVIVNKPAGLLSIPDRHEPSLPNLSDWLRESFEEVYVVHRLDKDTSGLICFALTADSHKKISLQFEHGEVEKRYYAFVDGIPPEEGSIDVPLLVNKQGKVIVHKKGKASLTNYKIKEKYMQYCMLDVELKTGRTHQIRVHLQHIGHPLLVDADYGKRHQFFLSEIKGRKYKLSQHEEEERPLLKRQPLHAYYLSLRNPETGEKQVFEASLPKDLRALEKQLQKWNKTMA